MFLILSLSPHPHSQLLHSKGGPDEQNYTIAQVPKLREALAILARETAKRTSMSQKVLGKPFEKSCRKQSSNAVYKPTQAPDLLTRTCITWI